VYATTVRELEVARGAQKALEEELQGALVSRGELEQRTGESAGEVAELRGQVEALQQADREWQDRMSGLENQLVRFEAALSSREEESAGLRAELKQALAEREQLQDEMAGQISQLAQQLREKDKQILQATQAQAHAQAQAQLANQAAQAAQAAAHVAQTAQAAARPPSSPGNPAAEKEAASLRVRLSDISAELKALRAKSAKAASGGGASADEVAKLRDELEAQRAENDFLNNEIERLRAGRSGAQAVEGDETAVLDLPNLK
jgi:chromosome segregation ATPase